MIPSQPRFRRRCPAPDGPADPSSRGAPRRAGGRLLAVVCGLVMGLGLAACGSHRNFVELKAHDRTFGEIWEGIDQVASSDGFRVDSSETDRGRGIYQTRWDRKVLNLGRSGRRRLHAEIVPDPDATEHSMVRFYVEQEKVTDLGKTFNVEERDWDSAGQDTQYQQIFVERLARVLGLLQSSNGPSSGPSSGPSRGQVPTR